MADLLQYQPVTGPVWREPVAEKLAWLPEGQQPARGLPPNRLGDFVRPEFAALYVPANLDWIAADRYAGKGLPYSLPRSYALDPIPSVNPAWLSWQSRDSYSGRPLPRASSNWTVFQPVLAYDPQTLEWTPKGTFLQNAIERRTLGDFQQPAFASLYRPEGLQWVLEGQQPSRVIPFVYTGSWVCDPTTPATVVFDPALFPFSATDLAINRQLPWALKAPFVLPEFIEPTPPVPPAAEVAAPVGHPVYIRKRRKSSEERLREIISLVGEKIEEKKAAAVPAESEASAPIVGVSAVQRAAPDVKALEKRLARLTEELEILIAMRDEEDEEEMVVYALT